MKNYHKITILILTFSLFSNVSKASSLNLDTYFPECSNVTDPLSNEKCNLAKSQVLDQVSNTIETYTANSDGRKIEITYLKTGNRVHYLHMLSHHTNGFPHQEFILDGFYAGNKQKARLKSYSKDEYKLQVGSDVVLDEKVNNFKIILDYRFPREQFKTEQTLDVLYHVGMGGCSARTIEDGRYAITVNGKIARDSKVWWWEVYSDYVGMMLSNQCGMNPVQLRALAAIAAPNQ